VNFLNQQPLLGFLAVVLLPTGLVFAASCLVRRTVPLAWLRRNNEVGGFKYQAVSAIYAVLLGFVVVAVWERFHEAEGHVTTEATGWTTLNRLSIGLPEEAASSVREAVLAYLELTIEREWPAMARGQALPEAGLALTEVTRRYLAIVDDGNRTQTVVSKSIDLLTEISQARRARLGAMAGSVPRVLWFSLVAGSVIMVGFSFFLASENLFGQAVMTAMVAFTVTSLLYVAVLLDQPFAGPASIGSQPLEHAAMVFRAGRS
jgi:hypothetical protein